MGWFFKSPKEKYNKTRKKLNKYVINLTRKSQNNNSKLIIQKYYTQIKNQNIAIKQIPEDSKKQYYKNMRKQLKQSELYKYKKASKGSWLNKYLLANNIVGY